MSRLRWTLRAQSDLLEIARFIARDNPEAARRWVAMLRKRARAAARMPRAGRRVPELGRDDVREVVVRRYRIVYQIAPDGIVVLVVFESHRQLPGGIGK
jgi:plasmid stabilization system protein ParE